MRRTPMAAALLTIMMGTAPSAAYDEAQLQQLLRTNSCSDCDLSYVDLTSDAVRAWIGGNLMNARLRGANLTGANLTVNLYGADLADANLTNANLSTTLTDANLTRANLTGANLTNARLTGAWLTGADLTNADLTGATWTEDAATEARWSDVIYCNTRFSSGAIRNDHC